MQTIQTLNKFDILLHLIRVYAICKDEIKSWLLLHRKGIKLVWKVFSLNWTDQTFRPLRLLRKWDQPVSDKIDKEETSVAKQQEQQQKKNVSIWGKVNHWFIFCQKQVECFFYMIKCEFIMKLIRSNYSHYKPKLYLMRHQSFVHHFFRLFKTLSSAYIISIRIICLKQIMDSSACVTKILFKMLFETLKWLLILNCHINWHRWDVYVWLFSLFLHSVMGRKVQM